MERRQRGAPLRERAAATGSGGVLDGVSSHTACIAEKACVIMSS
jgi:hypothetical protein